MTRRPPHGRARSASSARGLRAEQLRSCDGFLDEVAGDLVARRNLAQHGTLGRLPQIEVRVVARAVRAPRVKAATARRVAQVRRRAGDACEALERTGERRERLQQSLRVRMLRI